MARHLKHFATVVSALLMLLTAVGCAAVAPKHLPPAPVAEEPPQVARGWWYVRFIRDWPEASTAEPAWFMDLLIANEIVAPVLERHRANIPLWRFHRRAGHDKVGHALSLIIYASPAAAEAVYAEIRSTPLLDRLLASGKVTRVTYDPTDSISRPGVGDVSDKSWPPVIQKAWPNFIMGASQTWLDLVSETAVDLGGGGTPATLDEYETLYRRVNDTVDSLWREDGRHAFLHHLNALFGYQPLIIYEKKLLTF